jgi:hypothetical protein
LLTIRELEFLQDFQDLWYQVDETLNDFMVNAGKKIDIEYSIDKEDFSWFFVILNGLVDESV